MKLFNVKDLLAFLFSGVTQQVVDPSEVGIDESQEGLYLVIKYGFSGSSCLKKQLHPSFPLFILHF